jgi:hypothetical protein
MRDDEDMELVGVFWRDRLITWPFTVLRWLRRGHG